MLAPCESTPEHRRDLPQQERELKNDVRGLTGGGGSLGTDIETTFAEGIAAVNFIQTCFTVTTSAENTTTW